MNTIDHPSPIWRVTLQNRDITRKIEFTIALSRVDDDAVERMGELKKPS